MVPVFAFFGSLLLAAGSEEGEPQRGRPEDSGRWPLLDAVGGLVAAGIEIPSGPASRVTPAVASRFLGEASSRGMRKQALLVLSSLGVPERVTFGGQQVAWDRREARRALAESFGHEPIVGYVSPPEGWFR